MGSIPDYLQQLKEKFGHCADWGSNLAAVLAMERELPPMDPAQKTERTRFHGCQSQIWLILSLNSETGTVEIAADSDARIVRGLLAIAYGYYNARTPKDIAANPPSRLREAGLLDALAPSRANGFYRLLVHIHNHGVKLARSIEEQVA